MTTEVPRNFIKPLDLASIQEETRFRKAQLCNNGSTTASGWCPEVWDGIICWPSTAPLHQAIESCPLYITGFDAQENATKLCMDDGGWYWDPELNSSWSNYTRCYTEPVINVLLEIQSHNVTSMEMYLPYIKGISKIGYSLSFCFLVIAFFIFSTLKKLRCQRNKLHMNLFASFMIRALMFFLKNILFVGGVGLSTEVLIKDGESYWLDGSIESNFLCKAFTSIWQYCILANYSWILMEGLYLHNLLFYALFNDSNASIHTYVLLGWGMPSVVVILWALFRMKFEDDFCWTTHEDWRIFLLIRIPITLSVIVNFIIFVNIVRMLLSKIKMTVPEDSMRYKKWARSTLVLVPLFGVHYFLFLGMSYSIGVNETIELIWLFCDQLFASSQGFFVAILYCFTNKEVVAEISRLSRRQRRSWIFRLFICRWISKCMNCTNCVPNDEPRSHCAESRASTQDIGTGTRGGSLASSRGHLDSVEVGNGLTSGNLKPLLENHALLLKNKHTDQSFLLFCSNLSDESTSGVDVHAEDSGKESLYELRNLKENKDQ